LANSWKVIQETANYYMRESEKAKVRKGESEKVRREINTYYEVESSK
jgi:hypothetical protein